MFGTIQPYAMCRTPTKETRQFLRESFPMPRVNERKINKLAAEHEIELSDINVQHLLEDFQLRHRHLQNGDLSDEEKKRIAKKIPPVGEPSDYQSALLFLTLFMCKGDRDKACAILACFARLGEANIRRRVNKLINTIGAF